MKKSLILAVAAIAVLSSCNKENIEAPEEVNAPVFSATIEGYPATKTQLAEGSATGKKKVEWLSTDEVVITGVDSNGDPTMIADYSVTPGTDATTASLTVGNEYIDPTTVDAANYFAFYPNSASLLTYTLERLGATTKKTAQSYIDIWKNEGSLSYFLSGIYLPSTQKYNGADISEVSPMVAVNDGGPELAFKNLTALLAIMVPADDYFKSVEKIEVTADKPICGSFSIDFSNENLPLTLINAPSEDNYSVTLDCQGAPIPSGGTRTFYISIPAQQYSVLNITLKGESTTITKNSKDGASINVERNKIYPIVFKDTNLLPGDFSVSATKKVRFTKSNIFWDGESMKFEANQTDNPSSWSTSHVGHFYWTKAIEASYDLAYVEGNAAAVDDIPFFAESKGGLTVEGTTGLYVLTQEELTYLFGRNNSSLYKVGVIVNGKTNCLIIAPDGYANEEKPLATTSSYTLDEVNSLGLVCLPSAGYRKVDWGNNTCDIVIDATSPGGSYLSSTPSTTDLGSAYILDFSSKSINTQVVFNRSYGQSIRLVKTVE